MPDASKIPLGAWVALASGLALGFLAERFVQPALARLAARTPMHWDKALVRSLRGLLIVWLTLAGLLIAAPDLGLSPPSEEKVRFFTLLAGYASLVVFAARFAGGLVAALSEHVASTSILRNVVRLVVYVVGGLVVLDRLGIAITPVLTVLGVGGLAVSLALKDTLSNLFAGMQIVASGHVRVGDAVRLEAGEEGIVSDIQWRVTTVRTNTNSVVVVPNAKLAESVVTNLSRPTPDIVVRVPFAVGFGSDLGRIEQFAVTVGRQVQKETTGASPEFEPVLRVAAWSDSGIALVLLLRAQDPSQEGFVRHEALKRLHARLAAEGVAPPFAGRSVRFEGQLPKETP